MKVSHEPYSQKPSCFQEFAIGLDQQLSYRSLYIPFDLDITDCMGLLPS